MNDEDAIFIICLFTATIIGGIVMGAMDANADTPAGDEQEIQSGSDLGAYYSETSAFCRQMNGTLWVFSVWEDPADTTLRTLYGYFSSDNGSTWNTIVVSDSEDAGYDASGYPELVVEACALSNNSIILGILTFDYWGSSSKSEYTILCHWNNSDLSQWEFVSGYYASNADVRYGGMGVNETDKIAYSFCGYVTGYNVLVYSFDPETRTTALMGSIYNRRAQSPKQAPKTWLFWNNSDVWNCIFCFEPGTGVMLTCYNVTSPTLTVAWDHRVISTTYDYMWDIVYCANGTYFWMGTNLPGTAYFGWPYYHWYNPDTDEGAPIMDRLKDESYWGHWQLGLSNYDENFIQIVGFNYNTDEFAAFGGHYWGDTAYFSGTEVAYFAEDYDVTSTFRYEFAATMPYQLYPRLESNHTQLPATLGFPTVSFCEYDSGDTNIDLWVDFNTSWPGVRGWTYFPPEPEPEPEPEEPEDGDDDTSIRFKLDEMGELWVLLAVTAVFVSLARTYKMHIYRKRW